jgi:integrase
MKGSIQRRGDRWRIVVEAPRDPVTGKRRQVVRTLPGDRPRREAEALQARLLVEVGAGEHAGSDSTLDQLLDAWLDVAQLSPSTRRDYGYARRLIPDRLRRTVIYRVTARDLDALYAELARSGRGPDRIRRVHGMIRRALAHAVRWGWVARNVAVDASPPAPASTTPKPPTVDEVKRLLAAAADGELVTWLRLEAGLGARLGEMCALRWGDVDIDRATITVQRSIAIATGGIAVKGTKTDRVRVVALDTFTAAALREHRRVVAERALAVGVALSPAAYVFARDAEGMTPWRPDSLSRRVRVLRRSVGLDHVELRALRHFVITQLLSAGVDPRTVAGRAGHARTSTTLDIYAAFVPARDRDAAELLGRLVGE